jgi:AcrR family transcriptional regulator
MPAPALTHTQAPARVPGRERLGEIQRARILSAMSELVRERGASAVTIAHVVERSGVSRRTFYELFGDREDCFLAAFERALAAAAQTMLPAHQAGATWRAGTRATLHALLSFLEAEPIQGYLCIVGSLSAGPRALTRRAAVTQALVDAVHEGRRESTRRRPPDRLTAEGVVGAVLTILAARLQAEDEPRLQPLLNPLMAMIALPYLGTAAAERELKRAIPRRRTPGPSHQDHLRGLDMRLTYRTIRVLFAIAEQTAPAPASERSNGRGPSNRQVAVAAGIADQGQISKLLARLHSLGLVENTGGDNAKGEPNAWHLTARGRGVIGTLRTA